MPRHYLDHASTSPARPEVVEAMLPWIRGPADPGRVYAEGQQARHAVEDARQAVAALVGSRPREVVFTSGATEAVAAAVWGVADRGNHVVCPAVEHSSVRDASSRYGYEVTEVGVDRLGRVDPDEVLAAIRPDRTAVVHLQWGNHEVGTLQPVAEVAAGCRDRGVLLHVDAAAAVGHVPVDFAAVGADLLSISAHKLGGPQGVGALLVRRGLRLRPLLVGGEQERGRRAGVENVAGIVGFAAAATTLVAEGGRQLHTEAAQAREQTAWAADAALSVSGVVPFGDTQDRLPHMVCLGVEDVEAEAVVLGLDRAGVAVHSGSACSSEALQPSPVLEAMGVEAARSLRVSVGWSTTNGDISAFGEGFATVVGGLRRLKWSESQKTSDYP